jgi:hypothetical protein
MAADKDKTMNGPFSMDALDGTDTTVLTTAITGRENDQADINTEPMEEEAGDYQNDKFGEKAMLKVTIPEIDSTMKADLEGGDVETVTVNFTAKSMKWEVTGIKDIKVQIQDKKSVITVTAMKFDGTDPWTYTSTA